MAVKKALKQAREALRERLEEKSIGRDSDDEVEQTDGEVNGVLWVKLIKAENLMVMSATGTADPYVQLKVGTQKKRSKMILLNLNPKFNEYFRFDVGDPSSAQLKLKVFDRGVGRVHLMGRGSVKLDSLTNNFPTTVWVDLNTLGRVKLLLTADGFGKESVYSSDSKIVDTYIPVGEEVHVVPFTNSEKKPLGIYEAFHLKEGDLLLFNSGNDLFSRSIRRATKSHWDHVGLVVFHDDDDHLNTKKRVPRLLEALETGVKVYPNLITRLEKYGGNKIVGVRRLNKPLTLEMHQKLQEMIKLVEGTPYTESYTKLFKVAVLKPKVQSFKEKHRYVKKALEFVGSFASKNEETVAAEESSTSDTTISAENPTPVMEESSIPEELFCSQLAALMYQKIGVLSAELGAESITPRDFSSETSMTSKLTYLNGYRLFEEIYLEREMPSQ